MSTIVKVSRLCANTLPRGVYNITWTTTRDVRTSTEIGSGVTVESEHHSHFYTIEGLCRLANDLGAWPDLREFVQVFLKTDIKGMRRKDRKVRKPEDLDVKNL